jgi:hypothetical protein
MELAPQVRPGVAVVAKEGEFVDWSISWQNDLSLHRHSTSIQHVLGPWHLGSSEHSNFQQQVFGNSCGTKLLHVAG